MRPNNCPILAVLAAVVLAGCEEGNSQPPQTPQPALPKLVGQLSAAKSKGEGLARLAASQALMRDRRRRRGIEKYDAARGAYNAVIDQIIVALGPPTDLAQLGDIDALLTDASGASDAFEKWYRREREEVAEAKLGSMGAYTGPSLSLDPIGPLVEAFIEYLKMCEEQRVEYRARMERELNGCKWDVWPDASP